MEVTLWLLITTVISLLAAATNATQIPEGQRDVSIRIKRDPGEEDFLSKVEQMTLAARIVSAVGLRAGLADGSIPSDEAIAELLNIPSIKMSDLQAFDKGKVYSFFKKLESLAGKEVDVEKGLIAIEQWTTEFAEMNNIGANVASYSAMAGKFANSIFSSLPEYLLDMNGINGGMIVLAGIIEKIRNLSDDSPADINLSALKKALDNYDELEKLIDDVDKSFNEFKALADENQMQHYRFAELAQQLSDPKSGVKKASSDSEAKTLKGTFKNAAALPTDLDAVKTDVDVMLAVVSALNIVGKVSNRHHTAGLINGFNDLRNISNDVQNEWMQSSIPGFDANRIGTGLAPFGKFYTESEVFVDRWKTIVDQSLYESIQLATKVIGSFGDVSVEATAGVEKIINCFDTVPKFDLKVSEAIEFRKKFNVIISSLDALKKTPFKEMAEHLNFFKDNKVADVKQVKEFAGTEKLFRIIEAIRTPIADLYKELKDIDALKVEAGKIGKDNQNVVTFIDSVSANKTLNILACTHQLSAEVTTVSKAIRFIGNLRQMKASKSMNKHVGVATAAITESQAALEGLQTAAAAAGEDKPNSLQEFAAFKKSSKPFGDAVVVLTTIRRVLEKKESVKVLMTKSHSVDQAIASIGDGKLKMELEKAWSGSDAMMKSLSAMMDLVNEATTVTRRKRDGEPSGLSSFGTLFTSLSSLNDVKLDVDRRLDTLAAIISQSSPKDILDVQKALKDVRYLDLEFASHQSTLTEMPSTLADIDSTFATSKQQAAAIGANGNSSSEWIRVKKNYGAAALFYFVIIGGFIYAISIIVVSCFKCKEYKEYDKRKKKWTEDVKKRSDAKKRRNAKKKKKKSTKKGTKKGSKGTKRGTKKGSKGTKKGTKKGSKGTKKGSKKPKRRSKHRSSDEERDLSRRSAGKVDVASTVQPFSPEEIALFVTERTSKQGRIVKGQSLNDKNRGFSSLASQDASMKVPKEARQDKKSSIILSSTEYSRTGSSVAIDSCEQLALVGTRNSVIDELNFNLNTTSTEQLLNNAPQLPSTTDCILQISDDDFLHDYDTCARMDKRCQELPPTKMEESRDGDVDKERELLFTRALESVREKSKSVDFAASNKNNDQHNQIVNFSEQLPPDGVHKLLSTPNMTVKNMLKRPMHGLPILGTLRNDIVPNTDQETKFDEQLPPMVMVG